MKPELDHSAAIKRRAANSAKAGCMLCRRGGKISYSGIPNRFGELRVIRKVENRCFKRQLGLFSCRNFEIFLKVEVKIVSARVTNICIEPWRITKCLGNVAAAERSGGRRINQTQSWAGPGKVHCLVVEPEVYASTRPRNRSGVAN